MSQKDVARVVILAILIAVGLVISGVTSFGAQAFERMQAVFGVGTVTAAGTTTPLHAAAQAGNNGAAATLIRNGADSAARDENGRTPLHLAAQGGHRATAEVILEGRGDVNATDAEGHTALYYASKGGHQEMIQFLISNGAKP